MVTQADRPTAAIARLVNVRLDHIHLPDPADAIGPPAHRALAAEADAERLTNLLRPPLLVSDQGEPGHYLIVGNQPTFLRQIQLIGTDATRPQTVTAVVLEQPGSRVAAITPLVEKYLIPLAFGELSVRKAAAARGKLREAGLTPPRSIPTRAAIRRLVKRPTSGDDA